MSEKVFYNRLGKIRSIKHRNKSTDKEMQLKSYKMVILHTPNETLTYSTTDDTTSHPPLPSNSHQILHLCAATVVLVGPTSA